MKKEVAVLLMLVVLCLFVVSFAIGASSSAKTDFYVSDGENFYENEGQVVEQEEPELDYKELIGVGVFILVVLILYIKSLRVGRRARKKSGKKKRK